MKMSLDANSDNKVNCNCVPSCTSINYETEVSESDVDFQKMLEAAGVASEIESGMVLTVLKFSFKDNQFTTSTRSGLYSSTDFIADCGGLLGKIKVETEIEISIITNSNFRRSLDGFFGFIAD